MGEPPYLSLSAHTPPHSMEESALKETYKLLRDSSSTSLERKIALRRLSIGDLGVYKEIMEKWISVRQNGASASKEKAENTTEVHQGMASDPDSDPTVTLVTLQTLIHHLSKE